MESKQRSGRWWPKELLNEPQELLEPLRFSHYETGELHLTSNSPFSSS
jgi:hypothetical protein